MSRRLLIAGMLVLLLGSSLALTQPAASVTDAEPMPLAHCSPNHVSGANWEFCYVLDNARAQGLELSMVYYQGTQVFNRVGFPFSITKYHSSYGPFKDLLGTASSTAPGYGNGAMDISLTACPRFLGTGTLQALNKVCVETGAGPNPRVTIWSRFDIYNYRFIQGYHFHSDGTFQPFVMLGGNLYDLNIGSCTNTNGGSNCMPHHHYLYWRFDVDLAGPSSDRLQEFKFLNVASTGQNSLTPPACPSATASWCALGTETGRTRSLTDSNKWRVVDFTSLNSKSHPRSIEIHSGSQSPADTTSTRDVWGFVWKGSSTEIGYEVPQNPTSDSAVNAYANSESLSAVDLVLWYSEKTYHDPRDEETPTMMYHTAGPTLKIRNFVASNNQEASYP